MLSKTGSVILLFLGLIILLSIFLKFFRFNLITGGEHLPSRSSTKREAIKRGVYVCDLELPYTPYYINDTLKFTIKEGWVEKSWRSGYWYWTTIKEEHAGYSIRIKAELPQSSNYKWVIRNDKKNSAGYEQLGYYNGWFGGRIERLPESDTITYNVLKTNTMDFSDQNVLGQLKLVLTKN